MPRTDQITFTRHALIRAAVRSLGDRGTMNGPQTRAEAGEGR